MTHVCEKLRFVTAGLLKASVELLELFAGRIDVRRKRPKFVPIGNVNALAEVARRYSIQTVVDNADRFDHRSGDRMSQDQRKNETCQRDGGDKYLRFSIGLPTRIYAGYHIRFSPVDQLIGQSFELAREGTELREFALFRVSRSPLTDEIDDV